MSPTPPSRRRMPAADAHGRRDPSPRKLGRVVDILRLPFCRRPIAQAGVDFSSKGSGAVRSLLGRSEIGYNKGFASETQAMIARTALPTSILLLALAAASLRAQPPGQSAMDLDTDPANLVNIKFQEDIRVFTVMAAINAAGFDYEARGREMSDFRRSLREHLAQKLEPALLARMQAFYEEHAEVVSRRDQHIDYTSLALILSGPPEFSLSMPEADMPGQTWRVRGFQTILKEFFESAQVEQLWAQHKPRYTAELSGYLPVLRQAIRETLRYFRVPTRVMLDRQIILIPDLLNAAEIVNARNLERIYYIVVGPTADPSNNLELIKHEYLHSLIDPLVEKYGYRLLKYRKLIDLAEAQPHLRSDLQDRFLLVVTESLIEALQLRMREPDKEEIDRGLVKLFRKGLVFAPYFHRSLIEYEKNDLVALPSYLEFIFQNFEDGAIRKDAQAIAKLEGEIEAARQAEAEEIEARNQEIRRHNRRISLLRESAQLMAQKNYVEAEAKLRELLAEEPQDGNASFYLAQVLSLTGRHSDAFEWYRRTSEWSAEAWVQASSVVRMGRIAASQERFREARELFERVLKMEGDLKGAKEEARELIGRLPPQG